MKKTYLPQSPQTQTEAARLERQRKDQLKLELIPLVARGSMKQADAAKTLNLTDRQVRRLVRRYDEGGEAALLHKARGKPSNHQLAPEHRSKVISLIRANFMDSGPRLISEELQLMNDMDVNPETIRRWMIEEKLWSPNDPSKVLHRQSRERRACRGELVQMDTSVHEWLGEGLGKQYMLAMIDDASNRVYPRLYDADTTRNNMDHIHGYLGLYGRPLALYVDHSSIFIHNFPNGVTRTPDRAKSDEVNTQVQRAAEQLGINIIYARSPQAKGRIERFFGTAQTKVIKMLAHRGIHTIDEANAFLTGEFFSFWEARYTVKPTLAIDMHRSIEGYDLDAILCEHEERVVTNDYTFQWEGWRYQIDPRDVISNMRRGKVIIEIRTNGIIKVNYKGVYINFQRIKKVNR